MPHFHLNLFNGDGPVPDEEGRDFIDLPGARAEAISGIRSLLASELTAGCIDLGGRIEIADPQGRVLQTVRFHEALEIKG